MGLLGGITRALFGGSKSKSTSESGNLAYPFLSETYSPQATGGVGAFNALGGALGLGGNFGDQQGTYNNFLNQSGYPYVIDQAMRDVASSGAGNFLLRSGSTAKALQDRAMNIGKTYYENYLDRLAQIAGLGQQGAGLIANAGQYSTGQSSGTNSSGGLGKALGSIFTAISDRRAKTEIIKLGEMPDGLGWYDFRYRWDDPGTHRQGVMADEVAQLRPWALGPVTNGFASVDYGAL